MSVGGIIVGLTIVGGEAHVSTAELARWKKKGPKLDLANATGVRVEHGGHPIHPGDILWWQGNRAMLSPLRFRGMPDEEKKQGVHFDIILKRIGYSHGTPVIDVGEELTALAEERCR